MQGGELVAAIVAGDPAGVAVAYDRYAASLYAYCNFRLSSRDAAAQAVLDTFAVATVKLEALRDQDRLGPWLHAVARNECIRRMEPSGGTFPVTGPIPVGSPAADKPPAGLPATLRSHVLAVCTDQSPTGRAHRAALAQRAGTFGPAGFPVPSGPSGPRWWRPVRRRPRLAAAVAGAVLAVTSGSAALAVTGGSHDAQVATLAHAGEPSAAAGAASSVSVPPAPSVPLSRSAPSAPERIAPHLAAPTAAMEAGVPSRARPASGGTATPMARVPSPATPAATLTATPAGTPTIPTPTTPTPTTPAPTVPVGQGYLMVSPGKLVLTPASGNTASGNRASGTFIITALNGPVGQYTVTVPKAVARKVTVSPASGSLPADGWVTVTVTVRSKVAIGTAVMVNPGGIAVTVLLSLAA